MVAYQIAYYCENSDKIIFTFEGIQYLMQDVNLTMRTKDAIQHSGQGEDKLSSTP